MVQSASIFFLGGGVQSMVCLKIYLILCSPSYRSSLLTFCYIHYSFVDTDFSPFIEINNCIFHFHILKSLSILLPRCVFSFKLQKQTVKVDCSSSSKGSPNIYLLISGFPRSSYDYKRI